MTLSDNLEKVYGRVHPKFQNSDILQKISERRATNNSYELAHFLSACDLESLLSLSVQMRDDFNPNSKVITFSKKVFINLINLCKDSCSYCTYKKEPRDAEAVMLSPSQVLAIAEEGKKRGCTEALIVTGERPETKYREARRWLNNLGHRNLSELIADLSEQILKKTGLLPHTNAGSLTKKEMYNLKSTNVSLGMMLENSSERLIGVGAAHENAPSKIPKVRMKSLVSAGEINFPITTGLLIGIGESFEEVIDSLLLIKEINNKYGHIQEVIMQNFLPKMGTPMKNYSSPTLEYFLRCIASARIILDNINLQVPPNLSPNIYSRYLDAGINDWGGISPLTPDYVNPECPWPTIQEIAKITSDNGYTLRARLPLYPNYIVNPFLNSRFVHPLLKGYIEPLVDNYGLVKEGSINNEY
ncbi:MAG TPA: 7,8-didemethyl-8-hydroxy-5-deazariboflavin synthase CofG [Candidatus Nitrosocosmicus sp.]|nr:7,8-didemethyl-8-hydroxy-5-deazariboflavin synthase CofG [Candidatus Nitrosocosmicus sp.]